MTPERARTVAADRPPVPRRIVVTGTESTGKTTLAAAIAAVLGTHWVPEYSRTYAEQVRRELTSADVESIAHGQMATEDAATARWRAEFGERRDGPPLVLDTDLVSTSVYAEHYYGACPPWVMAAAQQRLGDLYLLCEADLPWEADGVRDQPHARQLLHAAFVHRLAEVGARVEVVSGVGEERLRRALAAIERTPR